MSRTVAVVGGGVVGLSCAWHLQEHGIAPVVVERSDVGAGASWGNAGHVVPVLAAPLPERGAVRDGLRSLVDPRSAVIVAKRPRPDLLAFLAAFIRNAPHRRWRESMRAYLPLNRRAFDAFDAMVAGGVDIALTEAPFTGVVADAREALVLLGELANIAEAGFPVDYNLLTGEELRAFEPLARGRSALGIRLSGQRYLDPPALVAALAAGVGKRGGEIRAGATVTDVRRVAGRVEVDAEVFDAVVLATGAWLPRLARPHGVRVPMHAGRGYSLSVAVPSRPRGMLYFPGPRLAATPYRNRLRVTSLMELEPVDAPPVERHARRFLATARRCIPDADWTTVEDRWVGGRPLTADGRPVIGRTRTEGVYVAGGHGMWGVTLGPVTGRLLAGLVARGEQDRALAGFDPCRSAW